MSSTHERKERGRERERENRSHWRSLYIDGGGGEICLFQSFFFFFLAPETPPSLPPLELLRANLFPCTFIWGGPIAAAFTTTTCNTKVGGGEETANNGSCGGCRWHFPSCVYVLRAKARRSSYVFYYIGLNGLDEWVNFRIWRRGREESKKKKLAHILKFLFLPQPPTMEAQLEYAHFLHVWHQILHLQLVLIIAKKNSALELSRQFIKSALLVGCLLRLSSFPS